MKRKRMMKRISALALSAVIFAGSSMVALAKDRSYTYSYDYWGDVQDSPDFYSVRKVYTYKELGLDKNLNAPEGMFAKDNMIYICDTGNNRIIELERVSREGFEVRRIIDSFKGDVEVTTFAGPTDVAISDEGNIFIADKNNARVLKLDNDLNYIMQFDKPVDSTIDEKLTFQPNKIAIDTAERVYCIASGINKGLIKYENDGVFSGFVGATRVTFKWTDYIWKKIASQEQRALLESFVPTEYDNIYMDYEGFVYACQGGQKEEELRSEDADAVRKLNLMGNDILVRNGNYPVFGDLYWGTGGGYTGPSYFADVTAMENDVYVCLDRNRGRLFGYNDQGFLMFAFGGNGNIDGYFRRPTALEHMGYDLLVLDYLDCSITLFTTTEFGSTVYQAMDEFDAGEYDASAVSWQKAKDINGNYDLAYIGLGRALLRQERYKEAMEYFELKYDDENYSKAYQQYRKQWVEDHILTIVIVLLVVVLVPLGIGRVKAIKHEIDIADIFRV